MEPNPVHVNVLLKDLPISIAVNKERMKINIPKPKLFTNSDSIWSDTHGWNLGTSIIVIINDNTHFMKEIKLNEKPLKKHCSIL